MLGLAPGCGDSPTAALIEVESDFADEVTKVVVELRDAQDASEGETFTFDRELKREFQLPFSFRVLRDKGSAPFVVRATAYREDAFLAQAKLRVTLKSGETSRHTLWLLRACRDVQCGGARPRPPNSTDAVMLRPPRRRSPPR